MVLTLSPDATIEEVDDELQFIQTCLLSLEESSEDFQERHDALKADEAECKRRLARFENPDHLNGDPTPSSSSTRLGTNGQNAPSNSSKRGRAGDLDVSGRPSKRPTPDFGQSVSPSSSTESEVRPVPDSAERSHQRRLLRMAAARQEYDDYLYARSLSQQDRPRDPSPIPPSSQPSSSRPTVQSTFGRNGSIERPPRRAPDEVVIPPPPQAEPSLRAPSVLLGPRLPPIHGVPSSTPGSSSLPSVFKSSPAVVDLTDDRYDRSTAEINRPAYDPSNRHSLLPNHNIAPRSGTVMPGAYPSITPQGDRFRGPNATTMQQMQNRPGMVPQPPSSARQTIWNGITSFADNPIGSINFLVNGQSSSRAIELYDSEPDDEYDEDDEDDELNGWGSHHMRGPALGGPSRFYAGHDELYQSRYNDIANYDPRKTKEEINALLNNIRPDEEMPAHLRVQTPEGMAIQLHKYQELGLTWLKNCEDGSNQGGILADDMGLGKTIQMLALIITQKSTEPRRRLTLIVAPVALMRQWKQEIEQKIKPGRHKLRVFIHHGPTKKPRFSDFELYDVILTTYGSLAAEVKRLEQHDLAQDPDVAVPRRPADKCPLLGEGSKWFRVILDEAQCIKNKNTQTAKGAMRLDAKHRFCVTGTPMMNNVDELFSLISFLRIKPYCKWEEFRQTFAQPLKHGGMYADRAMQKLQTVLKAIMLRRTKKSTFEGKPILVLPERVNVVDHPVFDEDEKEFYRHIESRMQLTFNKYLERGLVGRQYSAILVLLLRMRQACCHPQLIKDFAMAAPGDLSADVMLDLARQLEDHVVKRIIEKEGNFECPICYDATTNPAIFIPCGHDTCSDCFARMTDPAQALAAGSENGGSGRCPNCRGPVDAKKLTDYESFKKVHQPELVCNGDNTEGKGKEKAQDDDSDSDTSDIDSDSDDSETEDDDDGSDLADFVVPDDFKEDDSETEVEDDQDESKPVKKTDDDQEYVPTKSKEKESDQPKANDKGKDKGKGKKAEKKKGKKSKKKGKKRMKDENKIQKSLAQLRAEANRNQKAKKSYLRRIRKDYKSSAKIDKTMEILKPIMEDRETNEKILIFSQWTSLLDLIQIPIDDEDWDYRRYDGSMNARARADAVDDFKDKRDVRIMLVSLKAGNAGLNLNVASHVIILDPFWNPYIEEQAIDRAHRLGQTRPVTVHRLHIADTIEDRIVEIQDRKRDLISTALDEQAGAGIARLGVQELAYLFGITRNANETVNYVPQGGRR